ncbi:MAG: hypothetical protein H7328_03355 [Bdellovibrio sp.]|nr:hypothetical protein [Bdellovibrio sp.]
MPELAAGYLLGFICTLLLVGLHIVLQTRKQKSKAMRQLQSNLKKINLFWSDSEADLKPYSAGAEKLDAEKSLKSILISGAGFIFLSWFGFLFQFILMLSVRFLAVKRLERNLFNSELAEIELSTEMIQQKVQSIIRI